MESKISIIVPVYNVERFLGQCLDSIVNQTYKNIEIILVEDGSPDKCGDICDEYAAMDERIIVIHKKNAGVSAARNDGIDIASGEWVMFVDPDDWLELDCCRKVIEIAEKNKTDLIYFQIDINDEVGHVVREFPKIGSYMLKRNDLQNLQLDDLAGDYESFGFESGSPWGRFFRRKFLISNGCRFPVGIKRRQDLLFNLYCLEYLQGAFFYDYIGYHNRLNSGSICHRYNPDMMEILLEYLEKIENFVKEFHNGDALYERMIGVQAVNIQGDLRSTLFFHVSGFMQVKKYRTYMDSYYANPVIKKYLDKPRISDFRTFRERLFYVLISRRYVYLYYYLCASLKRLKLFTGFIRKWIRVKEVTHG